MAHTPEPWNLDPNGWCYEADVWENQKLCCAAPLLLEALKDLDNYIQNELSSEIPTGIDINSTQFKKARAAIAAATVGEREDD